MNKNIKKILFIILIIFVGSYIHSLNTKISFLQREIENNRYEIQETKNELQSYIDKKFAIVKDKSIYFENINLEDNTVESVVKLFLKDEFNDKEVKIEVNGAYKKAEYKDGYYLYSERVPINSNFNLGRVSVKANGMEKTEEINLILSVLNNVLGEYYFDTPWDNLIKNNLKDDFSEIDFRGRISMSYRANMSCGVVADKIDFVVFEDDKEIDRKTIKLKESYNGYFDGVIESAKYKFKNGSKVQINFEVVDGYGFTHVIPKYYSELGKEENTLRALYQIVKDKSGKLI